MRGFERRLSDTGSNRSASSAATTTTTIPNILFNTHTATKQMCY